jgi:carbon-monoxide dehydrogenase small subunit
MAKSQVSMTVNGKKVEGSSSRAAHSLLREHHLDCPHIGCDASHCGACTVDLDGKSVKSCTIFAVQGTADIRMIEGMAAADGHRTHCRKVS